MSGSPNALESLTPSEIARALVRDPRLLLAVGPLEDHGTDLPVGAGYRIASAVVDAASAETDVLRAPGLAYGVAHSGWEETAGLTTLRRKTLHRALNELLAGWEDHGVEEFVLVTAHSSEAHLDALLMALNSHSKTTVFDLGSVPMGDMKGFDRSSDVRDVDRSVLRFLDGSPDSGESDPATYDPEDTSGEEIFDRWRDTLVGHLRASDESDPEG